LQAYICPDQRVPLIEEIYGSSQRDGSGWGEVYHGDIAGLEGGWPPGESEGQMTGTHLAEETGAGLPKAKPPRAGSNDRYL